MFAGRKHMVEPLVAYFVAAVVRKQSRCRSYESHSHRAALPVDLSREQASQNGEQRGSYDEVIAFG